MALETILQEAREAANQAIVGMQDGYPCGFAWVNIFPARGPFVKMLKDNKIGRKGTYGGWDISSYQLCDFKGQNMLVKEQACRAAVDVLKNKYGINASVDSRMD